LVGIYHSHPAGAALPSAADVAEATWPDVAYVIIGLGAAGEPEVRAWRLQHGQAREVRLNYADG
jgi:proteasome lid subunit RPN8/RPN11